MLQEGRPTGVTVLAVLAALGGVGPLAYGFISIIGSAATLLSSSESPALPVLVIGLVYLGVAALHFGVAWALFALRPWAWVAAVVVVAGGVVLNVVAGLTGNVGWPQVVLGSIVPAIVLVYLFRPHVREAFGR